MMVSRHTTTGSGEAEDHPEYHGNDSSFTKDENKCENESHTSSTFGQLDFEKKHPPLMKKERIQNHFINDFAEEQDTTLSSQIQDFQPPIKVEE